MFKLWQNETMTTEYGRQGANSRFQTLNFDAFPAIYDVESTIDDALKKPTTLIIQDSLA